GERVELGDDRADPTGQLERRTRRRDRARRRTTTRGLCPLELPRFLRVFASLRRVTTRGLCPLELPRFLRVFASLRRVRPPDAARREEPAEPRGRRRRWRRSAALAPHRRDASRDRRGCLLRPRRRRRIARARAHPSPEWYDRRHRPAAPD